MRHKISLGFNKSALLVARTLRCAEKNQEATERRKDTEPRPSRRPGLSDQMRDGSGHHCPRSICQPRWVSGPVVLEIRRRRVTCSQATRIFAGRTGKYTMEGKKAQ